MSASRIVGSHLRSNVIGYVAVFIALSGTAYAANKVGPGDIAKNAVRGQHLKKNSVGSTNLRRNAVRPRNIRKNAVRGKHVRDNSLRPKDVRGLDKALKDLKALQAALGGAGGYLGKLQSDLDALAQRVTALENGGSSNPLGETVSQLEVTVQELGTSLDGVLGQLGGVDLTDLDLRLDSVCGQLDTLTDLTGDLRNTLNALALLLNTLNGVVIPDYDETLCAG